MREIISLQVGQCGNRIGEKFWKYVTDEHAINRNGVYEGRDADLELAKANVYFHEAVGGRYVPRAIMVDLEPSVVERVQCGCLGNMLRPDNFIYGQCGAGDNFIKGFHLGEDYRDEVMDALRKEVERCDRMQGLQLTHSIGGGTGSGMGALLMETIRNEYPNRILSTFSIVPSPRESNSVTESLNALLSFHFMVDTTDATHCIDNEALLGIQDPKCRIQAGAYGDINRLVAATMSGITACIRFPGQLNTDLRKLVTNLVPFPRSNFLMSSLAPLNTTMFSSSTVSELVREMFDVKNNMVSCNPFQGRYLTFAAIFRGRMSMNEVDQQILELRRKKSRYFVDWIADHVKTAVCDIPLRDLKRSVTFLANNTSIHEVFKRVLNDFNTMKSITRRWRNRPIPFMHLQDGDIEDYGLEDAKSNVENLVAEYQQYQEVRTSDGPGEGERRRRRRRKKKRRRRRRSNKRS
ncbi:tubulin beta-4B chain-like [Ptychodera flava]|uniref:tubulin beta-4B chain-like n=1 Tax=Ptychodera flava TaxID=63121 RepID=UPI00396A78BC